VKLFDRTILRHFPDRLVEATLETVVPCARDAHHMLRRLDVSGVDRRGVDFLRAAAPAEILPPVREIACVPSYHVLGSTFGVSLAEACAQIDAVVPALTVMRRRAVAFSVEPAPAPFRTAILWADGSVRLRNGIGDDGGEGETVHVGVLRLYELSSPGSAP
jgi:hypothetical protein